VPERYTKIAVALHWIVAVLFLGALAAIYYRHWFTEKGEPQNLTAVQLHFAFGVSVGVFVILRVVWRLTHRAPPLLPGPRWEHLAAHVVHGLLYLVMIVMPLTGYLGTKGAAEFLAIVPAFPDTGLYDWLVTNTLDLSWEAWEKPIDGVHYFLGENVVWVLVTIHILAALYHQFVKRDRLMRRMWF
jgi:cytochrome b561